MNSEVDPVPDDAAHNPPLRRPLVICLATYRPDLDLLTKTLESIKSQSFREWVCLVRDDASGEPYGQLIRALLADDPRFQLTENAVNLGYTRNFESLLNDVPIDASFVALADQDDIWFENRLADLVAHLQTHQGSALVYHNVALTTPDGRRISKNYRVGQPPKGGASLDDLLAANLVTGWTALFRRDLLDIALPFPHPGPWVHDHWLACAARAVGPIGYVHEALGQYVQHGSNAVGAGTRGPAYWGRHYGALIFAWPAGFLFGLTRVEPLKGPLTVLVQWTLTQYRVRRRFVRELVARGVLPSEPSRFPAEGRLDWLRTTARHRAVAGREARAALLHFSAGELARHGRIWGSLARRKLRRSGPARPSPGLRASAARR